MKLTLKHLIFLFGIQFQFHRIHEIVIVYFYMRAKEKLLDFHKVDQPRTILRAINTKFSANQPFFTYIWSSPTRFFFLFIPIDWTLKGCLQSVWKIRQLSIDNWKRWWEHHCTRNEMLCASINSCSVVVWRCRIIYESKLSQNLNNPKHNLIDT